MFRHVYQPLRRKLLGGEHVGVVKILVNAEAKLRTVTLSNLYLVVTILATQHGVTVGGVTTTTTGDSLSTCVISFHCRFSVSVVFFLTL